MMSKTYYKVVLQTNDTELVLDSNSYKLNY